MNGLSRCFIVACISDLPAEEAIYHRKCFQYFVGGRDFSMLCGFTNGEPPKKRGRRSVEEDESNNSAFQHVLEYLVKKRRRDNHPRRALRNNEK